MKIDCSRLVLSILCRTDGQTDRHTLWHLELLSEPKIICQNFTTNLKILQLPCLAFFTINQSTINDHLLFQRFYFPLFHIVYNISLWWSMQLVNSFFWFHNELWRIFFCAVNVHLQGREVETQTLKMNIILYIEELTTAPIIIILDFSSTARWNVLMIFIFFSQLLDCTFWIITQWPGERGHLHRN